MSLSGAKKKGKKFLNPIPTNEVGFEKMIPLLKEYINNKAENTPKKTIGPFITDVSVYNTLPASGLRITLVGHSSLLIECDGRRILTDPVWGERASFLSFMGPKRFFAPPLKLNDLPPLDAILLSHDHYDHLDKETIRIFKGSGSTNFICSLGVGNHLENWGIERNFITELDWGDSVMLGADMAMIRQHHPGIFRAGESLAVMKPYGHRL